MDAEPAPSFSVRFANAFIVAYTLDALLSLFVLAVLPVDGWWLVVALQRTLASGVYLMVFVCLPLIAVSARLPMPLLLGLCLSVFWLASGGAPLPLVFAPDEGLPAALAGVQAWIAALVWLRLRMLNASRGWLLRDDTLGAVGFSLAHSLRFGAVCLLVVLPLAAVYLVVSLGTWLEVETERFVSVDVSGIQLADRRYALDGRELRLVGMMHLGEDEIYREITRSFVGENTIVLEEGVSDEAQVLTETLSYERLAQVLGLSAQQSMKSYLGGGEPAADGAGWPVVRNADIDASAFEPATLEVLSRAASVWSAEAPLPAFLELYRYLLEHPEDANSFLHDIIERRNRHLLGEITHALADYERVIVPWGALHLPEIEREMKDAGFVLEEETRRRVVAWETLFAALF